MLYWLYEILLFAWLLWSGLDEVVGYYGLGKVIYCGAILRGCCCFVVVVVFVIFVW